MRSPGTMIPTRFSGSAAAITTRSPFACGQFALGAQRFDGDWKRELLSHKSIDETPAADFAAIFKAAIADLQFAPARQIRFSRQQIAENHAVAPQQHPATGFDAAVAIGAFAMQERPASGSMSRTADFPDQLFPWPAAQRCSSASPERAGFRIRRPSPVLLRPVPTIRFRFLL